MKRMTLLCSALLLLSVAACEAEEEPAASPLLTLPTEPDATADASEGDTVGSDTSDTATTEDPAVSDVDGEDDGVSVPDAAADTAADATEDGGASADVGQEDVAQEDVAQEDVFIPAVSEMACKVGVNPGEAKFGDVDEQTDVLVSALTTCQKSGFMEGEPLHDCVRAFVIDIYDSSEDCAQCFALRADCLKNFCFMDCIMSGSSSGTDCGTCQTDNYCLHPFQTCSGLTVF